jgi:hypothetical protein
MTHQKWNQTMYRSMIGSLLYSIATRPNIMQVVGVMGRFHFSPKETDLKVVKKIFIYFKGTLELVLWYPKDKYFTLIAYTDADWDGSIDDRKSTSGGEFFLREFLVTCLSKKQTSTLLASIFFG